MKITSIHYNTGIITTLEGDEYVSLIRTLLEGTSKVWISWHACNDIIALARREAQDVIGASESVMFLELDKGMLVSSYFLDSLLVITPSHSDGYMIRELHKHDEPDLYNALAKEVL